MRGGGYVQERVEGQETAGFEQNKYFRRARSLLRRCRGTTACFELPSLAPTSLPALETGCESLFIGDIGSGGVPLCRMQGIS